MGNSGSTWDDVDVDPELGKFWKATGVTPEKFGRVGIDPKACPCEWTTDQEGRLKKDHPKYVALFKKKGLIDDDGNLDKLKTLCNAGGKTCDKNASLNSETQIEEDFRNTGETDKLGHLQCPSQMATMIAGSKEGSRALTGYLGFEKGVANVLGLGFIFDKVKEAMPWHKTQEAQFKNVKSGVSRLQETITKVHDKTIDTAIKDNMKSIREVLSTVDEDMGMTQDLISDRISKFEHMVPSLSLMLIAFIVITLLCL